MHDEVLPEKTRASRRQETQLDFCKRHLKPSSKCHFLLGHAILKSVFILFLWNRKQICVNIYRKHQELRNPECPTIKATLGAWTCLDVLVLQSESLINEPQHAWQRIHMWFFRFLCIQHVGKGIKGHVWTWELLRVAQSLPATAWGSWRLQGRLHAGLQALRQLQRNIRRGFLPGGWGEAWASDRVIEGRRETRQCVFKRQRRKGNMMECGAVEL